MDQAAITNWDAISFSTLFYDLRCTLRQSCKPPVFMLTAVLMVWLTGLLSPVLGLAQSRCTNGMRIEGIVADSTGAIVPGAQVQASDGEETSADGAGRYVLPCVSAGHVSVTVQAPGFNAKTVRVATYEGQIAHANVQLAVATVETDVQVSGSASGVDSDRGAATIVLGTQEVQRLSDDPDDFLQQLQMLAASGGGASGTATIVVDGFQNGSAMPPKNSIASIRVNPDLFSSEYEIPPWGGGRVEISTKPGADTFHGALFFTDSDGSFNATDPFSITATPASRRRYGFELSGPVVSKKGDFSLTLEKRDINEFNVVNAMTLDANGDETPLQQTVAAPERLWIASARGDWQVTPRDVATLSFSANVNSLGNEGVGGLTLEEAGYSSQVSEFDLRFTNMQTLRANLLHETRIGYTWKRTEQTPNSTAPSLQVAGYFLGGGATSQNLNNREHDLEVDDDVLLTHGKHSLKIGAQSLGIFVHDYDPDTFNGSYIFGGGSAPVLDVSNNPTGQTTTISAIEQYSRAVLNLPGGAPTTYQLTSGMPLVPLTQWRLALYAEDTIKLLPRFTVVAGMRYAFQTAPNTFVNISPRLGFSWALDKKSTWVVHARGGLFSTAINQSYATEVDRLNGTRQKEALVYSPSYSDPLAPVAGSIQVGTVWQFPHAFEQLPSAAVQVGIEHDFPHHWHPSITYTFGDDWGILRSPNINAPLVASSIGIAPDPNTALLAPRPITPNENIMQYQNSGHSIGSALNGGLQQSSYKRFIFGMGYWYSHFWSDGGWNGAVTPQSTYNNKGEFARPDMMSSGGYAYSDLKLPEKIELSTEFFVQYGTPYNITTGTDANGDGNFNDRPSYASAPGAGVYSTHYGLLTANTVNGDVPRNLGTMPAVLHSYMDLSRAFQLNPKNAQHPRTLTLNARSANLLNHTNVTAVETVLSPTLEQPLTSEAARRVELGVRFAF
jgi:Carboxypeptidase regulatory-like domain